MALAYLGRENETSDGVRVWGCVTCQGQMEGRRAATSSVSANAAGQLHVSDGEGRSENNGGERMNLSLMGRRGGANKHER